MSSGFLLRRDSNKPFESTEVSYHKVPKFSDARNFPVIHLKFKQRSNLKVFCQKHANGIANSEGPDQTAPL